MSNVVIKDSVIFITAANRKRGIGRALVEEGVKRGAKKIYATARNVAELNDLAALYPEVVVPLSLDVTNRDDIENAAQHASDTQILINNAGVSGYSGICFHYDYEAANQEFEVNFWGTLNLIRAFYQSLIKNQNGAIANVVSIGGLSTFPLAATYCASKAAEHSLTQSVRAELAPHGIKVFGIYPGPIDTDIADDINMEKETPANAAIRIFDGIERGTEYIITDKFAEEFVARLRKDAQALEKDFGDHAHRMEEEQK